MKMRVPAVPLITVDPYFSVWSCDSMNTCRPFHWTGVDNTITGIVTIDGNDYRFLGCGENTAIPQISLDMDAMSTTVVYANDQIRLTAVFTSPLLVTDLYYASRPVSYLKLNWENMDGQNHTVSASITCSEELALNKRGEGEAVCETVNIPGAACIRMGNKEQKVLWRSGDDIRIDWGYLYLAVKGNGEACENELDGMKAVTVTAPMANEALFAFAYDDIDSIIYFQEPLKAYWKKDGKTIEEAIREAFGDYETICARCAAFSAEMTADALKKGTEQYAELLTLAYRQVMAAHKLVVDKEGNNLYISKECFSNGCAATVDVTYPSAPMFLLYNPELLKGMLRPVLRYARTDAWTFDFAPHDVGQYPILNGQVYCENKLEGQMPIEECGNVITLIAAICQIESSASFALEYLDLLEPWKKYLVEFGEDPGNQLCTDDFAGHLAHNCNLSIKAIMGIAGYSRILKQLGRTAEADALMQTARNYADSFCRRAANADGSYRLAYDQDGTFSLKYNAIWDKLWETNLFPAQFYEGEIRRYYAQAVPYGIPLDNRSDYTKSDWIHWVSCLGDGKDFRFFTMLLWHAYNATDKQIPMTDWYYASTAKYRGFKHRTVQGGLFMKLLMK